METHSHTDSLLALSQAGPKKGDSKAAVVAPLTKADVATTSKGSTRTQVAAPLTK